MFFSKDARDLIDREKGLFDFARMFITVIAFLGLSALVWKIWSLQNLELEIGQRTRYLPIYAPFLVKEATFASAVCTSLFTLFLWGRVVMLSLTLSFLHIGESRTVLKLAMRLLIATFVLVLPLCMTTVLVAILQDIPLR